VKNKSDYLMNKTGKTGKGAKAIDLKKIAAKWMLMALLAMGTMLVATKLLAAEDNPYQKNYKAQNTGNLVSLQASPDTKMYVSNHKEDDNISMLESGYDMMGSSGFEAGDVKADLALQHGKAIKADTVLVYSKYANVKTDASKIQMIREAAKKGNEIDEKDLEDKTNYAYYASYWAKLPAPLLGVHIIKLVPKQVDEAAPAVENKGLKVLAVIKDSPAAKAGLVRGDVLMKIADAELNKPEELSAIVGKHQGKNVMIEYERDGAMVATKADINKR
jgi:membrane-associated protease RseP (regulator of RpoE activity)